MFMKGKILSAPTLPELHEDFGMIAPASQLHFYCLAGWHLSLFSATQRTVRHFTAVSLRPFRQNFQRWHGISDSNFEELLSNLMSYCR